MPIVTIGIDLAKNVFAVHGVDESGKATLIKPRVPRDQLATLIAQLPLHRPTGSGTIRLQ
jgi:transposase